MASEMQTVIFSHGIDAGPEVWNEHIASLGEGWVGIALPLAGFGPEKDFSLANAAIAMRDELNRLRVQRAHLVGLSLGGMAALQFAIDFPDRVASLVVTGNQVRMTGAQRAITKFLTRFIPGQLAPAGISKKKLIALVDSVGRADMRDGFARIIAPTLVLCGTEDHSSLPFAQELAAGVRGAELQLVPGADADWAAYQPAEFMQRLTTFYATMTPRRW